jgi:hypothetical protein
VNGGSGYFDGTGDYLTVADNSALSYDGDFTIEFWLYRNTTSRMCALAQWTGASGIRYRFEFDLTSGKVNFTVSNTNFEFDYTTGTHEWVHWAAVRSGSTITIYENGNSLGSFTSSSTLGATRDLTIGQLTAAAPQDFINGYLSNVRIVKGTAITPPSGGPTSPLTAVSGTSLLLNFTNAGIFDQTGKNNLETVGNAQIDTTTKKFGTGSMEFDGTGDYFFIPSTTEFGFGTGDYTIECWIYPNNVSTTQVIFDTRTSAGQLAPQLYLDDNELIFYLNGNARITGINCVVATQWQHIALVRSSGVTKLYVNGTQVGSSYTDTNNYLSSVPLRIGTYFSANSVFFNGFIDDFRATKGVARYTSAFTPPTAPFLDQ